jgi:hypothetical protein
MRSFCFLLLAFVIALSNAAPARVAAEEPKKDKSDNAGKIEGTKWSSVEGTVKGQKIPAGSLKLEFAKDGKMVYKAGPSTFTGTYELKAGDKVVFKLEQELAGRKEHEQKIVIKDGKLTISDPDGTTLDFEKVK